ncbi:MAG: hypothetical protein ABI402_17290 [Ferruginibacter sp.]
MKIETNNLITIKNYAKKENVTTSYIYKLIKDGRMNSFAIDGVQFMQKGESIPVTPRTR